MLETLQPAVLETSRYKARWKYLEYREAYANGRKEYGELVQVYKSLSRSKKVISVSKAMQVSGQHSNGYPILAIANAAAQWCWFRRLAGEIVDVDKHWNHPASAFVSDFTINPGWRSNRGTSPLHRNTKTGTFRFLRDWFPHHLAEGEIRARVPIVPPNSLPSNKTNLRNYSILWEADWDAAPVDPLLLRRITREFFVVQDEWSLTPTEQLVLEMATFAGE